MDSNSETVDLGLGEVVIDPPPHSQSGSNPPPGQNQNPSQTGDGSSDDVTPETAAVLAVHVLGMFIGRRYPDQPLTEAEQITLHKSFVPVARKHLAGQVPCEYVALGTIAVVVFAREAKPKEPPAEPQRSGPETVPGGVVINEADSPGGQWSREDTSPETARARAASSISDLMRVGT